MNEALAMDVLDLLGWKGRPEFLNPAKESQGFYQLRGPGGEKISLREFTSNDGTHIYVGGIYPWNQNGGDVLGTKSKYNKALDKHELCIRRPQVRILEAEATGEKLAALVLEILPAYKALRLEILGLLEEAAKKAKRTAKAVKTKPVLPVVEDDGDMPAEHRRTEVGD